MTDDLLSDAQLGQVGADRIERGSHLVGRGQQIGQQDNDRLILAVCIDRRDREGRGCQALPATCSPIAWLVLPTGVMSSIFFVQLGPIVGQTRSGGPSTKSTVRSDTTWRLTQVHRSWCGR